MLWLSLILWTSLSPAETWTLDGKQVEFTIFQGEQVACRRNPCQAKELLKRVRVAPPRDPRPDTNPADEFCLKIHGKLRTGQDAQLNENSFCEFLDGSLVSAGGLYSHVRRKYEERK